MPTKNTIPIFFWWTGYLVIAVWAQELSGGLDFLSPGLLICLQSRHWWSAVWLAVLWVLMQEGVGNLVFGVSILFYAGMFLFFLVSRWILELENPFFVIAFSLFLAIWSWGALNGAGAFQELAAQLPAFAPWVAKQWVAYMVFWAIALLAYRRWVQHGRV